MTMTVTCPTFDLHLLMTILSASLSRLHQVWTHSVDAFAIN